MNILLNSLISFSTRIFAPITNKYKNIDNVLVSPTSIYNSIGFVLKDLSDTDRANCEFVFSKQCRKENFNCNLKLLTQSFTNDVETFNIKGMLIYIPFVDPKIDLPCCAFKDSFRISNTGEIINYAEIVNYHNTNCEFRSIADNYTLDFINTDSFNGIWKLKLKTCDNQNIFTADKTQYNVEMMGQIDSYYGIEESKFKAIQIPYKNEKYFFLAILPNREEDLIEIQNTLSIPGRFQTLIKDCRKKNVKLIMPKFNIDNRFEINSNLIELGLNNQKSNTFLTSKSGDKINIIHKTKLVIDENGTSSKAIASDSKNFSYESNAYERMDFIMDKPFFFYITKKITNAKGNNYYVPLMMGTYMKPSRSRKINLN